MENEILKNKRDLMQWINGLDDLELISKLLELKNNDVSQPLVSDGRADYGMNDDFEERWAKAIPAAEMRKRTKDYLESLPWKK